MLISVVMPCLNEVRTLGSCIDRAHAGCRVAANGDAASDRGASGHLRPPEGRNAIDYEIIVADNGSSDGSPAVAIDRGARVVIVNEVGYGSAIKGGISAARGEFVLMGDCDGSYDFCELPRFLKNLKSGADLVLGNRFAGQVKPGAMPWHHRYLGNPILSGIGCLLYRTPCKDWHCGLRAFNREKISRLDLQCTGMDFASEMVIRSSQAGLRILEIPIVLYPDGRGRESHLRSFRDGWRHLKLMARLWPEARGNSARTQEIGPERKGVI